MQVVPYLLELKYEILCTIIPLECNYYATCDVNCRNEIIMLNAYGYTLEKFANRLFETINIFMIQYNIQNVELKMSFLYIDEILLQKKIFQFIKTRFITSHIYINNNNN